MPDLPHKPDLPHEREANPDQTKANRLVPAVLKPLTAAATYGCGVYQGWAEVFPRWKIGLAGKRVPLVAGRDPGSAGGDLHHGRVGADPGNGSSDR